MTEPKPAFNPQTGEILKPGETVEENPKTLFSAFLLSQREGLLHAELTEELSEVVQSVIDLNKGGSITIKLSIEPSGRDQKTIFVKDEVKVKKPEDRPKTLFFSDGRGNIGRRDPNQMTIGDHLKQVPARDKPKDLPKGE